MNDDNFTMMKDFVERRVNKRVKPSSISMERRGGVIEVSVARPASQGNNYSICFPNAHFDDDLMDDTVDWLVAKLS